MSERASRAGRVSTTELGARAEDLACRFLLARGLVLIARNYRSRHGEIDLVMRDGDTIVFVEVRMRSRSDFGGAAASIDARKRMRLVKTAEHYLQRRERTSRPCRFDAVCLTENKGGRNIEWIPDAFGA